MNETEFLSKILTNPLATVAAFYAGCLQASAKAVAYVGDELGLTTEQAGQQQIGFSDRTLGKQLPSKRIKTGREIRETLQQLNLYKANGRETLRGYVTVPIVDHENSVIGIRGHKIDPQANGPESIVIGRDDVSTKDAKEEVPSVAVTFEAHADEQSVKSELLASLATACSAAASSATSLAIIDGQIVYDCDDRHYRIRGLERNTSTATLKITLQVSRDSLVHLDSLDLVKARSRASFIKAAATELYVDADTIKKDIAALLLGLETLQSDRIAELKQPAQAAVVTMTDSEQDEALSLLRDPNLLGRIVADMDACGIVGESTNKLAGYLAATSRKLPKPLAVVIQSSSSAGKTSLMDAVLAMMPDEDVNRFSGMTGQSLFYLDSDSIRHKILAIAEDEGIARATYALKLLQSEGELRHATVGRGENGRSQTQEHHVRGPVQIFLTTTAMDIDEELVNRCLLLSVDESRRQTGAIQCLQRDARAGILTQSNELRSQLRVRHQNAQRLIRPLTIVNPYAPQLTFANNKTRLRRDHEKYLTLIDTVALLHQHSRQIQTIDHDGRQVEYTEVTQADIAVAGSIAGLVLGRSLDELAPQTRTLLNHLHDHVDMTAKSDSLPRDAVRFTRRDIRESTSIGNSQLSVHLNRLVDMEYVVVHRGKNGRRYVYELLYHGEGRQGQPFLMGLIDPAKLTAPKPAPTPVPAPTTKTFRPVEPTFRPEHAS